MTGGRGDLCGQCQILPDFIYRCGWPGDKVTGEIFADLWASVFIDRQFTSVNFETRRIVDSGDLNHRRAGCFLVRGRNLRTAEALIVRDRRQRDWAVEISRREELQAEAGGEGRVDRVLRGGDRNCSDAVTDDLGGMDAAAYRVAQQQCAGVGTDAEADHDWQVTASPCWQ